MTTPLVAVFGSGAGPPEDLDRGRALGLALARAGYGVINGGYGGVMDASARGASEAGGLAIGVTCKAFVDRAGANPHCTEVIEAATLVDRLAILIDRASAYVVLPGGVGTLIELALAWEHLRRDLVTPRPLVVWEEPWRRIARILEEGPYAETGHELLTWVSGVEEAVAAIRAGVPVRQ